MPEGIGVNKKRYLSLPVFFRQRLWFQSSVFIECDDALKTIDGILIFLRKVLLLVLGIMELYFAKKANYISKNPYLSGKSKYKKF